MEEERRRSRRYGWSALALFALAGLALEGAHGFKVSAYLDDELVRLLLRLGHAHGALLGLVVLAYAESGVPLLGDKAPGVGRLLRAGALLLPIGFFLGAIAHPEGDPGVGILLAPIGGLLVVASLIRLAWASWRGAPAEAEEADEAQQEESAGEGQGGGPGERN